MGRTKRYLQSINKKKNKKEVNNNMGMTQNFYAVEKEDIIDDFDFRDNHGDKYGWSEFANFSKDYEIYNWMHTLWKKKVADSPSHGNATLEEEYLLLNEDNILQLEKDFQDKKIRFNRVDEDVNSWLEERFREFLDMAKRYIKSNFVIYYEAR